MTNCTLQNYCDYSDICNMHLTIKQIKIIKSFNFYPYQCPCPKKILLLSRIANKRTALEAYNYI